MAKTINAMVYLIGLAAITFCTYIIVLEVQA